MPLSCKDKLDYSWNWFEYHATQRLTALRFYLIVLGILFIALNNAVTQDNMQFVAIIGFFGSFLSVVFFALDSRNEELVNIGRNAIKEIEDSYYSSQDSAIKIISNTQNKPLLASHWLWLKAIYLLFYAGFILILFNPSIIS